MKILGQDENKPRWVLLQPATKRFGFYGVFFPPGSF